LFWPPPFQSALLWMRLKMTLLLPDTSAVMSWAPSQTGVSPKSKPSASVTFPYAALAKMKKSEAE
jgi:hypothetical protein